MAAVPETLPLHGRYSDNDCFQSQLGHDVGHFESNEPVLLMNHVSHKKNNERDSVHWDNHNETSNHIFSAILIHRNSFHPARD